MQDQFEPLVTEFLGPRFAGRRYLRYSELRSLGLVGNRATLNLWMRKGAFPAGLKIPGAYGKTLVWLVPEVVRHLAERAAQRDHDNSRIGARPSRQYPQTQANAPEPLATVAGAKGSSMHGSTPQTEPTTTTKEPTTKELIHVHTTCSIG